MIRRPKKHHAYPPNHVKPPEKSYGFWFDEWQSEGTTLPEELPFVFPDPAIQYKATFILVHDDLEIRYRQLLTWWLHAAYWYWCCNNPQFADCEYDAVKQAIRDIESDPSVCVEPLWHNAGYPNGYSLKIETPIHPSRYPEFIQSLMQGAEPCLRLPWTEPQI